MNDTVTPEQSSENHLTTLRHMRERAVQGGGPARIEAQHAKGKMTARERLSILIDEGSFQELGALATHNVTDFGMADKRFPGDGVITGFAISAAMTVLPHWRTAATATGNAAARMRREFMSRFLFQTG